MKGSLELAARHDLHSIAFPSISTGIYGYPLEGAAEIAVRTVYDFPRAERGIELLRFVLWNARTLEAFQRALDGV